MIFLCIHNITNENSRKMFLLLLLLLSLFPVSTFNIITMKLFFITYNFRFQFTIFIMRRKSFHSPEWQTSLVKS